jgi:adenosine deaminase
VNFVQPEDWLVPVRDYDLHMKMLDYMHRQYPKVNITLHAGELAFGQVMPDVLGTHIPKAIDMGHAQRIGHGVDVMYYPEPDDLLQEMAQKHVAVEIALTSNDFILGVRGEQHPFMQYMKAGVPLVLATDDEGVSRSDITHEYQRAVETYGLSYADLKRLSRNSLEYSFLPGASMWSACPEASAKAPQSTACNQVVRSSEKAKEQGRLEQEFAQFEKSFAH